MASSSLSFRNWSYNVFASFHGPDVRKTLLSHMRQQFSRNGITMFDDQGIERSAMIAPSLTEGIRESRIAIVILSKKYASSSWCLDELVEILECKEAIGQIVMTIFYGVDPSDVRKQKGEFGIAFNETCTDKTDEERQKWSRALKYVGNIAGEDFLRWDNEANMIKKIARDVSEKMNATPSRDFDGMIGLEAHLKEMESLLEFDYVGVKIVAISGPAGIVFFNYKDCDLVKAMFLDSDLDVKHGLKILVNRSLIQISAFDKRIVIHKLLQRVGKRAIHNQEPWKRQILMHAQEISDVLEHAKGTRAVSGISFDIYDLDELSISEKAFKKMPNLRFLRVYKSKEDGSDVLHIPEEMEFPRRLRLLHWEAYPNKCLPPTFHLEYLVELNMKNSKLEYLWQGTQPLTNLKKVELSGAFLLKELPDLSEATNLKTLDLTEGIRESMIAIVILSKKYASSSWCLDELVEILECKEAIGQIVMTIFYGVDPSDVRKQKGEFGIAFNETCTDKTDEERQKWSRALKYVGNIAGEDFLRWDNEANMIKKIARDVSVKLQATPSRDFDGMVGHEAHLKEMECLLELDYVGVKIVAISGPAGIVGSSLRGKEKDEWEVVMNRLESILDHQDIEEVLRVGYESLHENEQSLFLHIAVFFNNKHGVLVKAMFAENNNNLDIKHGLKILVNRSLIYPAREAMGKYPAAYKSQEDGFVMVLPLEGTPRSFKCYKSRAIGTERL
ncbi:hypothetical protein AALP_AA3G059400 [Arabis alpina]|uniref:TIR domain-containing protein n=1 Tax=Arabis alpina TaxID=50452 RepID=A0A087H7B5_ARAAL|nr:hypothetical protein AALP_AA3G059400 [Arabis alpina]